MTLFKEKGISISKKLRIFYVLLLSFSTVGCVATVQHHGVLIEEAQIAKIKVGQSTQKDVQAILGTPSSIPPFDQENVWYYVSRDMETVMFFTPRLIDSTVYVLTFSPQGILQKMEKVKNDKITKILPVKRTTPSVGHETPIMKRLLRNLGKNPEGPSKTGP